MTDDVQAASMKLGWNRDQDGIITVYLCLGEGLGAAVADFWITPLVDKLGMPRAAAAALQQRFAEMLVEASRCKICDNPLFPGELCPGHHSHTLPIEDAPTPPSTPEISVAEAAQRLLEDFDAMVTMSLAGSTGVPEGLRALIKEARNDAGT